MSTTEITTHATLVEALKKAMAHAKRVANIISYLQGEVRPVPDHSDPGAVEDCWNEMIDELGQVEKVASTAVDCALAADRTEEGKR